MLQRYLLARLGQGLLALILLSMVSFALLRILPGDVALSILSGGGEGGGRVPEEALEALREDLGLHDPIHDQYIDRLLGYAQLDLGESITTGRPISDDLSVRLPVTLELAAWATVVSLMIGIPAGSISAVFRNSPLDHGTRFVAILGLAIPNFWLAIVTLLALVRLFGWIPPLEYSSLTEDPWGHFQQMIFPVLILGYGGAAGISRMFRSSLLEVLSLDYIRTARSKGVRERSILLGHAFRNAALPTITLVGIQFASLMGGAVILETIFGLPGVGSGLVSALRLRDFAVVEVFLLTFGAAVVLVNLGIDILYAVLDPRVRLGA
ncbi:MAG: ABC transporter permease subunit [Dehalococcoidia bacterium]|nr:ABC transporter permease subunit [Dehalococcoidia bacterium]